MSPVLARNESTIHRNMKKPLNDMTPPQTPNSCLISASLSSSVSSLSISTNKSKLSDQSHLKPGENASLLSHDQTIQMYGKNAKKSNNMDIQCDFAIFLIQQSMNLIEAEKILKQNANRGHGPSQYSLGTVYAHGKLGSFDLEKAFPLFVQAAKHHHPDAAYRAAKCYEDGLGTRKDKNKAVQYYRKSATLNHPGAMYRLGLAELKGELGLSRNIRDGHKWLKRSAEAATAEYPHALHELGQLHETGLESIIFKDHRYSVSLYHEAAMLGYAPSAYRLGECYEYGRLDCKVHPRTSLHYYSMAAQQQHPESCFALTAWYLTGIPGQLTPNDEQAYAWAYIAAKQGYPRAEYAIGYFHEFGIGATKNDTVAMEWYRKAAEHKDKKAIQRLLQDTQKPPSNMNIFQKATTYFKKNIASSS